jgi:hypothetical protein|tara:strand:- start:192 stop:824 length:633 start_codon:yes stop_codon:yes gene_type:complete
MNCPLCLGSNTVQFASIEAREYFRCSYCYLVFLNKINHLSPAKEKERYAQHNNDIYDSEYRMFLSRLYDPIVQKLPAGANGLDYGCGPGPALAQMFVENKFFVDVYDPYFFPDESFLNKKYKFVTCTEAAEHFYNPFVEFNKINEILEEGGWLGVMTNFFDESINFEDWYYRKDPTHVCFYSEQTFEVIASQRGWSYEIPTKDIVLFKKN